MRNMPNKKKFNTLKKTIHSFMKDEGGFVTKENILKVGLGTIASAGMLGISIDAYADGSPDHYIHIWTKAAYAPNIFHGHTHTIHQNTMGLVPTTDPNCQQLAHINGNVDLSHTSRTFHLQAVGEVDQKGDKWSASLNYDHA
ncbi:MAG: hypothetical protein PHV55_02565 [Candidatus Omnitrophica bacterium]|nr:hypothetical protein [Candidatus Omnitrophota bacterium]